MIEAVGAGSVMTGLRMIWTGVQWLLRSRQAPWSAVPISATIRPHILPWYSVRFFCLNEKPFAIELLSARTIRPKKLKLRRAASDMQLAMVEKSEAIVLEYLGWTIPEKMARTVPFEQCLFVKVEGLHGEKVAVDFELTARFFDNRRTELPVWVRTNAIAVT
jgi:hypothetical protein